VGGGSKRRRDPEAELVSPGRRTGGDVTPGPEDRRAPERAAAHGDEEERGVSLPASDPAKTIGDHDPEGFARVGMSAEAVEVDEAETMASSGDASNSFQEIASGSATGLGIDRGEAIGTGGLAAGEDDDEVAEGDWWRQGLEDPQLPSERSAERYDLEGRRLGWEAGADFEERQHGLDNKKSGASSDAEEPPTGVPDDYED
jgi:hypothetical protein